MSDETIITFGIGTAVIISCLAVCTAWRLGRRGLTSVPILIALVGVVVASFLFWYTHRALPTNIKTIMFSGISYSRE